VRNRFNSPLNNVRVASPCNVDWEQMIGNERNRFCSQCNLNVYNLSGMTRAQAEHLIVNNEGRLCVRYYRRADGSIITRDCPVGLRAIKRRVSAITRAVASAVLTFFAGLGIYEGATVLTRRQEMIGAIPVVRPAPVGPTEPILMGAMVAPPPTPQMMGRLIVKRSLFLPAPQSPKIKRNPSRLR